MKIMQQYYVYILKCSDGSYYTGHIEDLQQRLSEHRANHYACYTSTRLPIELAYYEIFDLRDNAIIAERKLKGWSRAKKKALINGDFDSLRRLAKRSKNKDSSTSSCQEPSFVSARNAPASGRTRGGWGGEQ